MAKDLLIIAFDGLDYELIQEFECESIVQQEFGKIDNNTDIPLRSTDPLFTSFLTGKTPKEHSVTGMSRYDNTLIERFENRLDKHQLFINFKGVREGLYQMLGVSPRKYTSGDIIGTPFTEITDSYTINVPVLDQGNRQDPNILLKSPNMGLEDVREAVDKKFDIARRAFLSVLSENYELVFCHFHKADYYQHIYEGDVDRLKPVYEELDRLAKDVKTESGFETVLFMSDHGLPEGRHHNTNAFYSFNREVGLKTPHITDFKSFVLEQVSTVKGPTQSAVIDTEQKEEVKSRMEELGYL